MIGIADKEERELPNSVAAVHWRIICRGNDVANQPQLREGLSPSSEQQQERISEWVDRVLEQGTDWPWD